MADFKKLNEYDVKDATARNSISSLDSRVTTLENSSSPTSSETLYNSNNTKLMRYGKCYSLLVDGASPSQLTSAYNSIKSYLPTTLVSDAGYTLYNTTNRYLAFVRLNSSTKIAEIYGSFGGTPTDFFSSTNHDIYFSLSWIK